MHVPYPARIALPILLMFASAPARAEEPADRICAGLQGEDLADCLMNCRKQPPDWGCWMALEYGHAASVAVAGAIRGKRPVTVQMERDGWKPSRARNLALFLDAVGPFPQAWSLPDPEVERDRAAKARVEEIDRLDIAGVRLLKEGNGKAATPLFRQAVERARDLGPDDLVLARSLANLGHGLRLSGDAAGARKALDEALALRERVQGANDPRLWRTCSDLAEVVANLGDRDGARTLYRRAIDLIERAGGETSPHVASLRIRIADMDLEDQRLEEARKGLAWALEVRKNVLGAHHPETADAAYRLGGVLRTQGDYTGAVVHHRLAVQVLERAVGPDAERTALARNNLAGAYRVLGARNHAKEQYLKALAVMERVHGADSRIAAVMQDNLAIVLAEDSPEEARKYSERALKTFEKLQGPEGASVAIASCNLAMIRHKLGEHDAAQALLERSIRIDEKRGDLRHLVVGLDNLGSIFVAKGDLDAAERTVRKAAELRLSALPPDHPEVAVVRANLGTVLAMKKQWSAAMTELHAAMTILEKKFGPDHPQTAALREQMAEVGANLQDPGTATTAASEVMVKVGEAEAPAR